MDIRGAMCITQPLSTTCFGLVVADQDSARFLQEALQAVVYTWCQGVWNQGNARDELRKGMPDERLAHPDFTICGYVIVPAGDPDSVPDIIGAGHFSYHSTATIRTHAGLGPRGDSAPLGYRVMGSLNRTTDFSDGEFEPYFLENKE